LGLTAEGISGVEGDGYSKEKNPENIAQLSIRQTQSTCFSFLWFMNVASRAS
jgi:hypothetical protein